MEKLLTVTTDILEVPTFSLKSSAFLMLFKFCTHSENKMGNKIPPLPPKTKPPPSSPPCPKKIQTTK